MTTAEHRAESGEDRMKIRCASWVCQLVLWGSLLTFLVSMRNDWLVAAVSFLVLLITLGFYVKMCKNSGTRQFVANLNPDMSVQGYMQQLKTTTPVIRFYATCWHVETHYRTVTDYHTDRDGRMYTTKR